MIDPFLIAVLAGGLAAGGVWFAIRSFLQESPKLTDALQLLENSQTNVTGYGLVDNATITTKNAENPGDAATGSAAAVSALEAHAVSYYHRLRLPLGDATRRLLALRGDSEAGFVTAKLLLGMAGLLLPVIFTIVGMAFGMGWGSTPLVLSLVLGVLGFFIPNLQLRSQANTVRESGTEALSVLFDLVVLERLANASAVQAITAAAAAGGGPVFTRVSAAMEYARLQQRSPWPELHRFADELELTELHDIADIMALDEQGAALAEALRARVREVRIASLFREKTAAQARTEAMTIWMVIPVLVFALIFLIPPLLQLTGVA
ncbi:MAG: hypothetical protein LBJ43_01885 [Propionibacteriaceae bacterium]|jgi:Flp pilus assembly protein TadB|nr:hypothetical protein [Propionibacteriaceae bacterium]